MQTHDIAICKDCEESLKAAGLVYKRLPGTEGKEPVCDFCKQRRYTLRYRVQIGRR